MTLPPSVIRQWSNNSKMAIGHCKTGETTSSLIFFCWYVFGPIPWWCCPGCQEPAALVQLLSWLSNQLHYYQLEDTTYCKLLFPQEMTQCLHDSSTFTCGPSGLDNSRFYLLLWRRCPTESWMSRPVDSASRIKQYLRVKVVVITMGNETVAAPAAEGYVTGDVYICY